MKPTAPVALASAVIVALALAPSAQAGEMFGSFIDIAQSRKQPAPLVPTRLPTVMSPLETADYAYTALKGSRYELSIKRFNSRRRELGTAGISLERGFKRSLKAVRKADRGLSRIRSTRVRGKTGLLLTGRFAKTMSLAWVEQGQLYEVSGGRKSFSTKELRATVEGLDQLEREYVGSIPGTFDQSAVAITTRRTLSLLLDWTARCQRPGQDPDAERGRRGSAVATVQPRQGQGFSFTNLKGSGPPDPFPWTNRVSGTISPNAIGLNFQASGTSGDDSCDTGPVTLNMDQRAER